MSKPTYLTPCNVGHVTQSSDAIHADHIVVVHLSPQEVVHDLLCQSNVVLTKGAHELESGKRRRLVVVTCCSGFGGLLRSQYMHTYINRSALL